MLHTILEQELVYFEP